MNPQTPKDGTDTRKDRLITYLLADRDRSDRQLLALALGLGCVLLGMVPLGHWLFTTLRALHAPPPPPWVLVALLVGPFGNLCVRLWVNRVRG
jgi:hypothetical protein